jgi:hypothetical protein
MSQSVATVSVSTESGSDRIKGLGGALDPVANASGTDTSQLLNQCKLTICVTANPAENGA